MPISKIKNSSSLEMNVKSSFSIFTENYSGKRYLGNTYLKDRYEVHKP